MSDTRTEIIRMRISPELKAALAEAAAKDGRTMSNFLEQLIKQALRQDGMTAPTAEKRGG